MFKVLPQVTEANSVGMWRALACATPWAIELLTATWLTGEDKEEAKFYSEFFGAFQQEADQVLPCTVIAVNCLSQLFHCHR